MVDFIDIGTTCVESKHIDNDQCNECSFDMLSFLEFLAYVRIFHGIVLQQ